MILVHLFTVIGVAVFAASGALAAVRRSLDPVGVLVLAIVTATGGGTLRDVLMDRHPVFWISAPWFIGVSALAALVTWLWVRKYPPPDKALQYADALGLAFFSIAGAQIAAEAKNPARTSESSESDSEGLGFVGTMRNERSHCRESHERPAHPGVAGRARSDAPDAGEADARKTLPPAVE